MSKPKLDPRRIEVVDDAIVQILRHKSPAERIWMGFEANRLVRLVVEGALRSDHPNWDDASIKAEVARRMLHGSG